MKRGSVLAIVAIAVVTATSCRKTVIEKINIKEPSTPGVARQVNFSLYTTKDFSTDKGIIQFKATIRNATTVLWDSTFAPMLIRDIPSLANKIAFEKAVPGNDNSQLSVGFTYYITNVGQSWYLEPFDAGQTVKTLNYNFQ